MDHQEEVAIELHRNALSETMETHDRAPVRRGQWWVDRPQEERRRQADTLDAPAEDPRMQRVKVEKNVRKFGHKVPEPSYRDSP